MSDFVVAVQGTEELITGLEKFGVNILKLKPEMEDIGSYLTKFWSGEVFASRGRVINQPWPALNPSYAAYKARTWPGRPPLIKTGLMNRSFMHRATQLSSSLWNESEYFRNHQEGIGVPQRVMMSVDQKRENDVVTFVAKGIARQMEASGV